MSKNQEQIESDALRAVAVLVTEAAQNRADVTSLATKVGMLHQQILEQNKEIEEYGRRIAFSSESHERTLDILYGLMGTKHAATLREVLSADFSASEVADILHNELHAEMQESIESDAIRALKDTGVNPEREDVEPDPVQELSVLYARVVEMLETIFWKGDVRVFIEELAAGKQIDQTTLFWKDAIHTKEQQKITRERSYLYHIIAGMVGTNEVNAFLRGVDGEMKNSVNNTKLAKVLWDAHTAKKIREELATLEPIHIHENTPDV